MIHFISIATYYSKYQYLPIVDVRSPGEFKKGHIHGAHNIALFTDEERARVGMVYKQESQSQAYALGYAYVKPKLQYFIDKSQEVAPNKNIVVHCWRGGMRSKSFCRTFEKNGFQNVYLIENGYKAYRNHVLKFFNKQFNLCVLGGYTGSGKTDILARMAKMGQQVIDLEQLANHKGSAFGGIGQTEHPTTEQFENELFECLRNFNINEPIWVEDESMSIGKVFIPKAFFQQIRSQGTYFLDIPRQERAKYLVSIYGQSEKCLLEAAIRKIQKRLGPQRTKAALESLSGSNFEKVASITLEYYDKAYLKGMQMRESDKVIMVKAIGVDSHKNAQLLLKLQQKNIKNNDFN